MAHIPSPGGERKGAGRASPGAKQQACHNRGRKLSKRVRGADFNTLFSGETESGGRFQPPENAPKGVPACNMTHIGMLYRPYCSAIQAISEAEKTLFAGVKRPSQDPERAVLWLILLHNKANWTNKSNKTNKLRLHTQNRLICSRRDFIFKFAENRRVEQCDF